MNKVRKHTPIVSRSQRGLFGAAYGAKKAHRSKPSFVPSSLWHEPLSILKSHLTESRGKFKTKKIVTKRLLKYK